MKAKALLFATNGYTDLAGAGEDLKRRIVPVTSSLIATAPLDARSRSAILPSGNVVTDANRLTNYFRVSTDGTVIFGGRGGASHRESTGIYRRLVREMTRLYPSLRGVPICYRCPVAWPSSWTASRV